MSFQSKQQAAVNHTRRMARRLIGPVRAELDVFRSRTGQADLALFHQFQPPPTGGGHQFLRALTGELRRRGIEIEENTISGGTGVCLFNSFNFDFGRLRRFSRRGARMVHRVDGPIGTYRGFDDGTDRRIVAINGAIADATIFQSEYSATRHAELGLELRSPVVISNAVDPDIFYPSPTREPLPGRRLRVVATSWSDNPRKGSATLQWLDRNADHDRVEITFVGRTSLPFERIRTVAPVGSEALAEILRGQDVYLAASRDDPCSNALLEGLACGLPAVYLRSGGHPELVGEGGIGFDVDEELPATVQRLAAELEQRRAAISVPRLGDVADRYLEVLRG